MLVEIHLRLRSQRYVFSIYIAVPCCLLSTNIENLCIHRACHSVAVMAKGAPETSLSVDVSVTMDLPSFVPGSRVSAVITIRSDKSSTPALDPPLNRTRFAGRPKAPPTKVPTDTSSPSGSATLRGLGADEYALLDYVVCQVAGRWTTDRVWVAEHAHAPASADSLDHHAQPPLSAITPTVGGVPSLSSNPPSSKRRPWDAALDDANKVGGGGRLGHSGVIFRSQTLVVCEREQVPVGSRTSFAVQCVLPDEIPPSLRGAAVRYSYYLVVVVGVPGSSAPKSVRLPFRVVCARTSAPGGDSAPPISVPTPSSSGPVCNVFLEHVRSKPLSMSARLLKSAPPDDIEVALALSLNGRLTPYAADDEPWRALHALDDDALSLVRDTPRTISRAASDLANVADSFDDPETSASPLGPRSRRASNRRNAVPVYAITCGKDSIARMYLPKRRLVLGDNISAVFYFYADKPCLQLGARLEMQEIVKPKYSLGTKQESSQKGTIFRKVFGEHVEFVMMNRNTHVTFTIPYDAPASFSTDVCEIRWLIHFVFLIPQQSRKLRASRLAAGASGILTEGTVLDDHEATRLLGDLEIEPESSDEEVPGWEGGSWKGEDVEVLRWTLPLTVIGEPNSQWGTRSQGSLRVATSSVGK